MVGGSSTLAHACPPSRLPPHLHNLLALHGGLHVGQPPLVLQGGRAAVSCSQQTQDAVSGMQQQPSHSSKVRIPPSLLSHAGNPQPAAACAAPATGATAPSPPGCAWLPDCARICRAASSPPPSSPGVERQAHCANDCGCMPTHLTAACISISSQTAAPTPPLAPPHLPHLVLQLQLALQRAARRLSIPLRFGARQLLVLLTLLAQHLQQGGRREGAVRMGAAQG